MVNYADETFYKDNYLAGRAAVITTAFPYYAREATQEIKRYTGDNVDEDNIPEAVQMCCCEIAEKMFISENVEKQSSGVSSESVGGWSKSYSSESERKTALNSTIKDNIYKWLTNTGLLYRGLR